MKKVKLEIIGLSYSQTQSGAYALVLGETTGKRRLPIIIGGFEAQAIAVEIENMQPTRPLTHDLFRNFAVAYGITIEEVIVYDLKEGIFYSKLVCNDGSKQLDIDARTSDAIAMAVRFKCPIYTYENILSQAGVMFDEESSITDEPVKEKTGEKKPVVKALGKSKDFSKMNLEELKESLMQAIDEEAYERASLIRDEINKRKKSS